MSYGETLTLNMTTNTIGGLSNGVNSNVSISCCPNGGSWTPIVSRSNDGTYSVPSITLNYNDKLCYDLSTTIISGNLSHGIPTINLNGCAKIKLNSIVSNGFNGVVINDELSTTVNYTTTTTTSTTTLQPIQIYMGNVVNNSIKSSDYCLSGNIVVNPPLTAGQSFRLYFTTNSCSSSINGVSKPTSTCSFINCNGSNCNYATSLMGGGYLPTNSQGGGYDYIDVNSSNINNITLCVIVRGNTTNYSDDYINCANLSFNAISNTNGGNFVLGNSEMSAFNTYTHNGVVFNGNWFGGNSNISIIE